MARPAKKATTAKRAAKATPAAPDFTEFLVGLRDLINGYLNGTASVMAVQTVDESEAEDEVTVASRRAELEEMGLRQLRQILIKAGYAADEVNSEKSTETLIGNILRDEFGDDVVAEEEGEEEEEDEEEEGEGEGEEEEEGEEDGEYTREDLLAMGLRAVRRIAIDEYGHDASELKGMDIDSIVELILGDAEEGEDEDEEEEEGGEEEGDYYTREDFEGMSLEELKEIADEYGVKYRKNVTQKSLASILGDYVESEEDEEEE